MHWIWCNEADAPELMHEADTLDKGKVDKDKVDKVEKDKDND